MNLCIFNEKFENTEIHCESKSDLLRLIKRIATRKKSKI